MNWYPLLFNSVYQETIWGGQQLWQYIARTVPFECTAESLEISSHPQGVTTVAHGPLRGKTLMDLIRLDPMGLLGKNNPEANFPLLVKLIGAERDLSIQVHPDDHIGRRQGVPGKTEAWYVLSARDNSRIIYGLKPGISKGKLATALQNGEILSCVNQFPVQTGDFIPIPAGCIHALGAGILVAEIQQNSDTTYRLYDWDRVDVTGTPRPLHLCEGLEAVNSNLPIPASFRGSQQEGLLFADNHFTISWYRIKGNRNFRGADTFAIWTVVKGKGVVSAGGQEVSLVTGSSVLLPADIKNVTAQGDFCFLLTLPFSDQIENSIVYP